MVRTHTDATSARSEHPSTTSKTKIRIKSGTFARWAESEESGNGPHALRHVAAALAILDSLGAESVSLEDVLATARFVRDCSR